MGRFVEPEITLSESDGLRYLHFGTEWVQGAMSLAHPNALPIEYTRQMMGWLLFMQATQRIVQLGLGAASLTRFCLAKLPQAQITVVEPSERVVQAARQWFHLPPESERFQLAKEDGAVFLSAARAGAASILQVDVYDAMAQGPVLDSINFYRSCRGALGAPGILAVNLFGSHASFAVNRQRIHEVFDGAILEMPQGEAGNIVVLAFKGGPFLATWAMLEKRARLLAQEFDLEAPQWVKHFRGSQGARARGLQVG